MKRYIRLGSFAAVAFAAGLFACGGVSRAAVSVFTDTFENDTVGQPDANWSIGNANGSTITGNVAQEGGGNKYLALRDTNASLDVSANRVFAGDTQGFLKFDIRFNQGPNQQVQFEPMASAPGIPSVFEPINVQWQHPNNNPNAGPLSMRSVGNGEYTYFPADFPIGSWQTVTIFFASANSGTPRGRYTVIWNGTQIANSYLDQGYNGQVVDRFYFSPAASGLTTGSIDFDNVTFVPEPAACLVGSILCAGMLARRRHAC